MKKIMNIIFSIAIPTMADMQHFLDLLFISKVFFEYRLLAAIPLTIVTGYIVIEIERVKIKQQG